MIIHPPPEDWIMRFFLVLVAGIFVLATVARVVAR